MENLEFFRIDWNGDANDILRRLKPIGDLTLTAVILSEGSSTSELVGEITAFLTKNLPDVALMRSVVLEYPQLFVLAGLTWDMLERLGIVVPNLRGLISDCFLTPSVASFERHAGHDLALYWLEEKLGLKHRFELMAIFDRCAIASRPVGPFGDTFKYYICHDLFFLADWGAQPLTSTLDRCRAWVPALHEWRVESLLQQNLDLAAEITLALVLSQLSYRTTDAIHSQDSVAAIPVPPPSQGWGFMLGGDSESLKSFFRNYHTVLACLMAINRGGQLALTLHLQPP
jgi:hypothetical protein